MMSADSKVIPSIPKETVRAANAVFGRGNFYIQVGENLDGMLADIHWQPPQNRDGISVAADPALPLITFFQFVEGLTDRQAADAMRTRIDWKFALHLALLPRMLDENALCPFRQGILSDAARQREYQLLIDQLVRFAPSLNNYFQDLESLELVSLVCSLNRLDQAQQAMKQALEALAAKFPQWLRQIALPHWYGRYNPATLRLDVAVLLSQQRFLMEEICSDIHYLLEKVPQSGSQELSGLLQINVLEQICLKQCQTLKEKQPDLLESLSPEDCNSCSHRGDEGGARRNK
jgi:transposase